MPTHYNFIYFAIIENKVSGWMLNQDFVILN